MINKIHLVLVILAFVVVDALATQDMDLDYDAIRAIEPNEFMNSADGADLTSLSENSEFPSLSEYVAVNAQKNLLHKRLPVLDEDFEIPQHKMILIDNEA